LDLADYSGLTYNQVDYWFAKKRLKLRKNNDLKDEKHISYENKLILENFFSKNEKPGSEDYCALVEITGLKKCQIYNWFSYKRSKINKNSL
jgi:hypothetical protein